MSEVVSDVLEDMVRTELTRQATAPHPDPDRILHRVRVTRRRTTTMTSAAVMVLVIVVGATVWTAIPRTGGTLPEEVRLGQPTALWFADPDHGYALVDACPTACQVWLAVTTDGGRSWHGRAIPGLTAAGHIHTAADGSAWISGGSLVLVSRDRGRTWREIPLPPGATPDGFDTYDGHHLYLVSGQGLWRKTGDDGDWQRLDAPTGNPLQARPQPDGGLLLTDPANGARFYAPPGSTAFQPTDRPDLGHKPNGARQLRRTGPNAPYEHSTDGHTWTPLPF
ncbi:WD40/YVTN/BNR-like repeat-containing protein [Allorhizocola rhizosphaerae]|uniref:WD40/YVTN/BNR-like repeat-containing protein n=1 Tax=Allorhizocola rhizosphaerae TaxID=1872709 RepID=UPI0013C33E2E|nr:hypothetical protein [Allorhizocola rhizosphaerae]